MQDLEKLSSKIDETARQIDNDSETETIDSALNEIGFTFLTRGSSRRVYVSSNGKYVIKFDKRNRQNGEEIRHFKEIPKQLKQYFLKPIAYDKERFRWILTHKAKNYNDLGFKKARKIAEKLSDIFEKNRLSVSDLHACNVGRFKRKPVVLDYGYPITDHSKA